MLKKLIVATGFLLAVFGIYGCGSSGPEGSSGPAMKSTLVRSCAKFPDREPTDAERGTEGETVPPRARSALICRWEDNDKGRIEEAERVVRSGPELRELIRSLNSLGVASDSEWEGSYSCPEQLTQDYGIGLRYAGPAEVQVDVTYDGCGYAWNIQEDTLFQVGDQLETTLDRLLGN